MTERKKGYEKEIKEQEKKQTTVENIVNQKEL